jgi:amidase
MAAARSGFPPRAAGVVGFKPSRGRLDMEGSRSLPVNVAVHGVITRSLRDTIAFPPGGRGGSARWLRAPTRALRIGVFSDAPGGSPVDPEVRAAVARCAKTCAVARTRGRGDLVPSSTDR